MDDVDTRTTGASNNSSASANANANAIEWCPDCDEVCEDHARICTVCGATLEQRPSQPQQQQSQPQQSQSQQLQQQRRRVPSAQETAARTTQLRRILGSIRSEIDSVDEEQQALLQEFQNAGGIGGEGGGDNDNDEWQAAPAAAMDPSQGSSRSRPTAAQTLQQLPRIKLTKDSFLFRRASLFVSSGGRGGNSNSNSNAAQELSSSTAAADAAAADSSSSSSTTTTTTTTTMMLQAIPGEFGPRAAFSLDNAALIVAQPRTGKGGRLSPETIAAVQCMVGTGTDININTGTNTDTGTDTPKKTTRPVILYMERGDNLTFVAKALLAQQAGASALIISNHTSQPWPYVMKDSAGEATAASGGKLTIPVVMIKQADGQAVIMASCCSDSGGVSGGGGSGGSDSTTLSCRLDIASESKECCVCRDEFAVDQTVLQLPACSHVFHEACATHWLSRHNTCPYCRYELPTDDSDYEQERRRTQRTHAGSQGVAGSTHWSSFYG